jgi:hypothetical protein
MARAKIVTYDLRAPGRDYQSLYDALKSYDFAKATESTYVLRTDRTCTEVRDHLLAHMDANDRLFVAELTGVAAWHNALAGSDAIKKRL